MQKNLSNPPFLCLTLPAKFRIIKTIAMDFPQQGGNNVACKYTTTPFRVKAIRTAGSNADRRRSRLIDRVKSSNFISWLLYNRVQPAQTCETVNKRRSIYHAIVQSLRNNAVFLLDSDFLTACRRQACTLLFLLGILGERSWQSSNCTDSII